MILHSQEDADRAAERPGWVITNNWCQTCGWRIRREIFGDGWVHEREDATHEASPR